MKRLLNIVILSAMFLAIVNPIFAQKKEVPKENKWGYVDTNFILSKMPDYVKAQQEVQVLSEAWSEELKLRGKSIDSLYNVLQQEGILLSLEEKTARIDEIKAKEDSLSAYRNQIFGFEGMFYQKKKELLKTVQDRLFDAVEQVAKEYELFTLFDKAGDQNIIYVNPIHDYSDYVLEKLGLGDPNDGIR